jgi:hypothetical protein
MTKNRQVNHIAHHSTMASSTLMRRSVNQPSHLATRLKANHAVNHHESLMLKPIRQSNASAARKARADQTSKSQYISHFVKQNRSYFVPTHAQPIKAIVHKPQVETILTIDELLLKAIANAEDQVLNLEQQPVRRLHRFTHSLVANRFNGLATN